jgi:hypothetical protein
MTRFKQVREAARNLAVRATGDDGEEAKLNDLPSDQSQQDDADENNRNPDGSAEDQVEKSIKPIYTKTENGIYTLNTESVDEKKAARLAKIARAAAAREKDQAAQKEKAKQKHYAASAKSRKAIDYFKKGGNKDQFGRVREDIEQVDELNLATKVKAYAKRSAQAAGERADAPLSGRGSEKSAKKSEKLQSKADRMRKMIAKKHGKNIARHADYQAKAKSSDRTGGPIYPNVVVSPAARTRNAIRAKAQRNEEIEQVDEISVKKKAQAYRKMRDRQADVSYNPHTGKSDMLADTPEKKRANRMLKRIGDKHGKDVKRAVYKSQYEEVEQTDESLRPASRSGIKDKFVHKEGLEQKLAKISESKDAVEIEITENTIDDIKKLTTLSQAGTVRFADGSSAKVSPQSATALLQTHGNLNTNNQKKFAKKLASSASEFAKLEKFALQQAKLTGRLYALNDL